MCKLLITHCENICGTVKPEYNDRTRDSKFVTFVYRTGINVKL